MPMIIMDIKCRYSGKMLFSFETDSINVCVEAAVKAGANLEGANLAGAENAEYARAKGRITPEEGAFVGWKKLSGNVIAKLIIPHDAERVNCFGSRKCRASKAYVESMFGANEAYDTHTGKLLYKVGEWVEPDSFDPSITTECSHGIHFFLTRIEAERY